MTHKEMMEKCKENGLVYTDMHMNRIGFAEGFLIKNKPRNIIVEEKFNEWLEKMNKSIIPDDCMAISEATNTYKIAYNIFKYHFQKEGIEMFVCKKGGLKYARKSDIERIVKKYNESVLKRRNKNNG